jgi:hypothetical protein
VYEWSGSHVALVVTGTGRDRPVVEFLAHARSAKRAATVIRRIEVRHLHPVKPALPLEQLADQLPLGARAAVDRSGALTRDHSEAVLDALTRLRPDLAEPVARLAGESGWIRIISWARELFVQERDATNVAFRIAGLDPELIADAEVPESDFHVPALATIPRVPAHEDHLIAHDAERFADWIGTEARHFATREFRKAGMRLFIANVNRRPLEETLGVDLIYHHVDRDSFILVQYKKMERNGQQWAYRPDEHLRDQLMRMREVEQACADAEVQPPVDYRLSTQPCWIKLCKADPSVPSDGSLIGGMYLSREHFEWLDQHPTLAVGPRGGSLFGFHNVPRYFGNTTFLQHVKDGWIGTRGTGSDLVRRQIEESQAGGRSVVFAALEEDLDHSGRRRRPRRQ